LVCITRFCICDGQNLERRAETEKEDERNKVVQNDIQTYRTLEIRKKKEQIKIKKRRQKCSRREESRMQEGLLHVMKN
jgi:hypothetical protein